MDGVEYVEKSFNSTAVRHWAENNKQYSIVMCFFYVVLTYGGQYLMRNRKPLDLKFVLFAWNFFLAVFSVLGAMRIYEQFIASVKLGMIFSVCDTAFYNNNRSSLWAFLFAFSKVFELGDTTFLVLRKRPIIFLHVYHHVTVLIYCAYAYSDFVSSGRWYGAMNYFIHSIMYTYYAFTALKIARVPRLINIGITSLQLLQMIAGLAITIFVINTKLNGVVCGQTMTNAVMVWLMYFSYFLLFLQYFNKTYGSTSKKFTKTKSS